MHMVMCHGVLAYSRSPSGDQSPYTLSRAPPPLLPLLPRTFFSTALSPLDARLAARYLSYASRL